MRYLRHTKGCPCNAVSHLPIKMCSTVYQSQTILYVPHSFGNKSEAPECLLQMISLPLWYFCSYHTVIGHYIFSLDFHSWVLQYIRGGWLYCPRLSRNIRGNEFHGYLQLFIDQYFMKAALLKRNTAKRKHRRRKVNMKKMEHSLVQWTPAYSLFVCSRRTRNTITLLPFCGIWELFCSILSCSSSAFKISDPWMHFI